MYMYTPNLYNTYMYMYMYTPNLYNIYMYMYTPNLYNIYMHMYTPHTLLPVWLHHTYLYVCQIRIISIL